MKRICGIYGSAAAIVGAALLILPVVSRAHCDTMDGPVISDARQALSMNNIAPVLKWIPAADEASIRELFDKTIAVRKLGDQARDLADQLFFETLVRVHRAGEGEPFTGLKPSGTTVDPVIAQVDEALSSGSIDGLTARINEHIRQSIGERFEATREARTHASDNVEAGRKYVETYVELMHFMERLHTDATTDISHSDSHEQQESAH